MVHAGRGIGKTHLALGIGYAVATGTSLLGWTAPQARRVIYLDGEMPATAMQRRIAAIVAGVDGEPPDPGYLQFLSADLTTGGLPDLSTEAGQSEIDAAVGDAKLIIVDNISTLVRTGRENEAESWLPVQGWALAHRRARRSVLFIHHDGKAGLQRGTSRREDVLDTVIGLRHPADYTADQGARFEITFEKARGIYGAAANPFEARYEERNGAAVWTKTEMAAAELARVAAAIRNGSSVREAADELGMSKSKVGRLRASASEQGMLDD
jgi:putative DNA primase/helicase